MSKDDQIKRMDKVRQGASSTARPAQRLSSKVQLLQEPIAKLSWATLTSAGEFDNAPSDDLSSRLSAFSHFEGLTNVLQSHRHGLDIMWIESFFGLDELFTHFHGILLARRVALPRV